MFCGKVSESMRNRLFKFLTMLMTVLVIGIGMTMFNLSMQEKSSGEKVDFSTYATAELVQKQEAFVQDGTKVSRQESEHNVPITETRAMADIAVQEQMPGPEDQAVQAYYARLQDMEKIYMSRLQSVEKESVAEQTKVMEDLLKSWDDELNSIYQKLRKSLPDDEFVVLRNEERAWIRNRDEAAGKAAAKENYSNSTQKLAYTRSLLEWTKTRVYELAEMYYGD